MGKHLLAKMFGAWFFTYICTTRSTQLCACSVCICGFIFSCTLSSMSEREKNWKWTLKSHHATNQFSGDYSHITILDMLAEVAEFWQREDTVLNVLELNPQTKFCITELLKHQTPPAARRNPLQRHLYSDYYRNYISEYCLLQWPKMTKYMYDPIPICVKNATIQTRTFKIKIHSLDQLKFCFLKTYMV